MRRREFLTLVGGAAVACPLAARAQQPAMPVIGFLHAASPEAYAPMMTAFRQGLKEAGYVEGRNLAIEYRWAEGHYDRLPELAADLVRRRVAEIVTGGTPAALAAKAASSTIPIVINVEAYAPMMTAFRQGLKEAGYVEGRNLAIEYRWAEGHYDRLPELAADLVRRRVAEIVTGGTPAALAAKAASSTIPIVINVGVDPVQLGLVASLNRPGGNVTGLAVLSVELGAKKLEVLHELLRTSAAVALLVNPNTPSTEPETKGVRDAARSLGLQLHVLDASTEGEIDAAFEKLIELRAGGLVVSVDAFLNSQRAQIVALAARHAVPAIYGVREFAAAGGLMSYGTDLTDGYRQVGIYAGKILKGAKPADLPVQRVVRVEFVINLKTAKTLGLTFPITLLGRADEVIE
jgi:putative tryptophan/tyrosine transport system substrate-binding protein